jgi:class 3 adenylate cyclase
MVDSTALASRIGDVRADAVRRAHRQATVDAVVEYGGEVVKDTGDGVMAAFGSAVAAMDAAVAAQRAAARLNRVGALESGEPLAIRVGVSIGEAVDENGDWFGTPVVEAARLCAAAADGQVLVSDAVRLMAGSRARYPLRGVGPMALKGLAEPLAALEVVWEASGLSWPLPAGLVRAAAARFVGRADARQALETAAKEAAAGDVRLVLVSGEPGVGKTSLAAEVAGAAHKSGAVVLYGRADPDRASRLQVWADAISVAAEHMTDRQLRGCEALGRLSAGLAARVGFTQPPEDGDAERRQLFESIGALLDRLGAEAPVLVVLDDLQWADEASLHLVRYLADGSDAGRLLMVATVRVGAVADDHPLMLVAAEARRSGAWCGWCSMACLMTRWPSWWNTGAAPPPPRMWSPAWWAARAATRCSPRRCSPTSTRPARRPGCRRGLVWSSAPAWRCWPNGPGSCWAWPPWPGGASNRPSCGRWRVCRVTRSSTPSTPRSAAGSWWKRRWARSSATT